MRRDTEYYADRVSMRQRTDTTYVKVLPLSRGLRSMGVGTSRKASFSWDDIVVSFEHEAELLHRLSCQ